MRCSVKTGAFTPIAKDLDTPRMLACDAAGNVYYTAAEFPPAVRPIMMSGERGLE